MDTGNIFSQMEQYDFSTPINVTMIFEEESDEAAAHNHILQEQMEHEESESFYINDEQNTDKANIKCNSTNKNISPRKESQISRNCNNNSIIEENTPLINNISCTLEVEDDESVSILNTSDQKPTEKGSNNRTELYQQVNDKEELTTYVKNLLNVLSEHLILVMQPYYAYYYKNRAPMPIELSAQYNKLKVHFFDLSYSTVVSLVLPQENNDFFINKLIDKTVNDANKVMKWKCRAAHVQPFFNEMIEWAKQKKSHINKLGLAAASGTNIMTDNRVLREKLSNPPQPMYFSRPHNTPLVAQTNNNRRDSNTENSMCIFTSGPPGREINININPDTLIHHTKSHPQHNNSNQQMDINEMQKPGNNHVYSPNIQPARQFYDNRMHNLQKMPYMQDNTIHHKPVQVLKPPPPYGTPSAVSPPTAHNYLNQMQENQQTLQNYQQNMHLPHYTTPVRNNLNSVERCNTQIDGQRTPVINNMNSLNPTTKMMTGRCCICGKYTNTKCSKCNKFSYCSHLCQELDSGAHNYLCGKTNN